MANPSPTPAGLTPASIFPPSSDAPVDGDPLTNPKVKRPPNAYLCFRSYFCRQKPAGIERHNATVSKITALAWKKLTATEKAPFFKQAADMKAALYKRNPYWKYKPRKSIQPKKERRRMKRTDDDFKRYELIAVGFNLGKRDEELRQFAEITAAPDVSDVSVPVPPSRTRRVRTATTTTRPSAKASLAAPKNLILKVDSATPSPPQPDAPQPDAPLSVAEVLPTISAPLATVPFSLRRLSLPEEIQPVSDSHVHHPSFLERYINKFNQEQPPFPNMSYTMDAEPELSQSSSILLAQDDYLHTQVAPEADLYSVMSGLQLTDEIPMATTIPDQWFFQQSFSPESFASPMLDQLQLGFDFPDYTPMYSEY